MAICMYCHGRGYQNVERGSGLCYACPDCGGNGVIPECENCGREYYDEYCERCYTECEECGEIVLKEEVKDGICAGCREAMEDEE